MSTPSFESKPRPAPLKRAGVALSAEALFAAGALAAALAVLFNFAQAF